MSETKITQHPFPPNTEVGIHEAVAVDVERRGNREPISDSIATATVSDDGDLSVDVEPGSYVAVAEVGEQYEYVSFSATEAKEEADE